MELKNWLSEQTHAATMVFHVGKYCDNWKASGDTLDGSPSFHLVLDGECWLQPEGTEARIHLVRNDVVFFFRNQRFVLLSSEDGDAQKTPDRIKFGLDEEKENSTSMLCGLLLPKSDSTALLFALMPQMLLVHTDAEDNARLRLILELLNVECHAHRSPCDITIGRLTDLLLLYVLETALRESEPDLNIVRAARVPEFAALFLAILKSPQEEWSLQRMAEATGLSRSTFIRRLSQECNGYTSGDILSRLRMSIAAAMMTGGMKAGEAGRKVGYSSASGFSRAARKMAGSPPDARGG